MAFLIMHFGRTDIHPFALILWLAWHRRLRCGRFCLRRKGLCQSWDRKKRVGKDG